MSPPLTHPLLARCGVPHGFGLRDEPAPPNVVRPRQVHGVAVARVGLDRAPHPAEADAVVTAEPRTRVGVVTADCVPVLASCADGRVVAAIHAGWRGLAAGVVGAGIEALRILSGDSELYAVIGPSIGPCCYEVDAPVLDALAGRFEAELPAALEVTREGHARIDLARLVECELARAGIAEGHRGRVPDACTSCDAERFHSYRRDGEEAGRLLHHIGVGNPPEGAG